MTPKPSSRATSQKRKSSRRWHLAPVITHGPEPLESVRLLDEDPSPAGLLLWQLVRDVHLWAQVAAEERDRLFTTEPHGSLWRLPEPGLLDAAVVAPVNALAELLPRGEGADPDEIAEACLSVSRWAGAVGRPVTALSYAQAASLARPDHAGDAFRVALLAQELGEQARAETWFRRTVTVARQSGDRDAYTLGLMGLGRLYRRRGSPRVAQRFFVRAQRAATRWGLRPLRATVLLELFGVAVELERFVAAEQYGRAAFEQSEAGDDVRSALPAEVARLWLMRGAYPEARVVLEALRPSRPDPADRVPIVADLVWALGGLGERAAFEKAWGQAWEELGAVEAGPLRAGALLSLANGAALMEDSGRALHAAEQAVLAAREAGDRRTRQAGEATLRALREGEPIPGLAPAQLRPASAGTRAFARVLTRSVPGGRDGGV
jgi:tetratricopeptide (TPR) repeat protein